MFAWIYAHPSCCLCSLEFKKKKNAHVYPNGLIFTLIPLVFTLISRENMLKIVASKVAKVPGVVQLRSFGGKPLKGINLSNEHSFVLFRGCRYIYIISIYICIRIWYLMIYIYICIWYTWNYLYIFILYDRTNQAKKMQNISSAHPRVAAALLRPLSDLRNPTVEMR